MTVPYKDPEQRRAYQKAYAAAWRARNLDKVRAYQRAKSRQWREEHPGYAREYDRAYRATWRAANPDLARKNDRASKAKYRKDNREKVLAYQRKWYAAHRDTVRSDGLKRLYGITQAEYDSMLAAQGGRCAICGTDKPERNRKYFAVDHCHKTGAIRKLLCGSCNGGLGLFRDDPTLLRAALNYLGRHTLAAGEI